MQTTCSSEQKITEYMHHRDTAGGSLAVSQSIGMTKAPDLSAFECGVIVDGSRGGSSISNAAALQGCRFRESCDEQNTSSWWHFCGQRHLVNERGQKRTARIITVIHLYFSFKSHLHKGNKCNKYSTQSCEERLL